jgi:hypothetical protein
MTDSQEDGLTEGELPSTLALSLGLFLFSSPSAALFFSLSFPYFLPSFIFSLSPSLYFQLPKWTEDFK